MEHSKSRIQMTNEKCISADGIGSWVLEGLVAGGRAGRRISGSIWIRGMRFSFSGWPLEKWNLHSADEKIRQNFLKHTLAPDWLCCDGNSCPACPRLYGVVIGQSCTFQGTQKYSQGGWVAARRSRPDAAQHRHQRGQMPPASSRTSMRVVYRAVPFPLLPSHTAVVPPLVTVPCRDIGAKLL